MKTSYHEADDLCGEAIKKLRKEISLTQEGLADRLGVTWRTVAGWEAGSSYPRAEHLKELIALAIQQQAFAIGHEAEEIRVLWKVAHQKTLLDECWLCALLNQRSCPQGQVLRPQVESQAVEETMTTAPARTTGATPPLLGESLPQTPSQTNADQPQRSLVVEGRSEPRMLSTAPDQTTAENFLHGRVGIGASHDPNSPRPVTDKTKRRCQWLIGILITLVILTIIGSLGTLFFQARHATTAQAYPSYLSGNGTPAFFDPLNQESGSRWSSFSNGVGGLCQFTGGAYHASQQPNGYFASCPADGIFSNFAFEVQLTVVQGDCGGLVFRRESNVQFYKFVVCQQGVSALEKYFSSNVTYDLLHLGGSSAIHAGLNHQNKMAVVVSGSTMTLYVNEQQIDQEQDRSYTSGQIALIANPNYSNGSHATDIAYSNARLWTL